MDFVLIVIYDAIQDTVQDTVSTRTYVMKKYVSCDLKLKARFFKMLSAGDRTKPTSINFLFINAVGNVLNVLLMITVN